MNTHFGVLVFAAVILGSALPANAKLHDVAGAASASQVMGYWGCWHYPTGGTVCEDDGYGPIEQRPRKK
jgi:hypothetical protein